MTRIIIGTGRCWSARRRGWTRMIDERILGVSLSLFFAAPPTLCFVALLTPVVSVSPVAPFYRAL